MPFKISDLYRTIVHETTASFIFGTTAAVAKAFLNREKNIISTNISALRVGVRHAEQALLYNTILFLADYIWIKRTISHILGLVICSFASARKNGMFFALKSAILTFTSTWLYSILR